MSEINRKRKNTEGMSARDYITIAKQFVEHIDSIEKLLNGTFSELSDYDDFDKEHLEVFVKTQNAGLKFRELLLESSHKIMDVADMKGQDEITKFHENKNNISKPPLKREMAVVPYSISGITVPSKNAIE